MSLTEKKEKKVQKVRSADWFGMDAGKIWISPDFDETPEEMLESIEEPLFPRNTDD